MADEVLGNIYEVLTIVAIEDYTTILKRGESVFWHEHPKGVLVEPDLTIGTDRDRPRLLLQVSHTNAERASEKKFWRNIGEFVDARLALGKSTAISNVVFDSGQKRRLAAGAEALFDGFLEADRTPYGDDLVKLGNRLVPVVGKSKASWTDRADLIRNYLKSSAASVVTVRAFAKDVEKLVSTSSTFAGSWFGAYRKMQSSRPTPRVPAARNTSVRRGLGRLLPIEGETALRQVIDQARKRSVVTVPYYFAAMGLVRKSIKGDVVADPEILGLVDLLNTDTIVDLWRNARSASKAINQASIAILKSSDAKLFHSFVATNYSRLSTPKGLSQALNDCFTDPNRILGATIGIANPHACGAWLFDYLMTVIKAQSGKQQGYGYTPLAKEAGVLVPGKRSILDFALPKYISRTLNLPLAVRTGVAQAIAARLKPIESWFNANPAVIDEYYLRGLFEDKIYKMAALDPLLRLLTAAFPANALAPDSRRETFLTHKSGPGSATCGVVQCKSTVILWQSASDSGVGHKMKELCGRIGMLRVTTNTSGTAIPDSRYKKALLLIDGTWTAEHIQRLVDAGFDEVYYPDEVDQLVAAIV